MKKEHVFLFSAVVSGLIAFWMLWPFADAILWAGFTAYLLHYVADSLNEYIGNRTITTGIVLLLLIGFVAGMVYFLLTSIPTMIELVSKFSEVLSGSASFLIELLNLPPSLSSSVQNVIRNLIS
ncbi:MAG: AI-2E family transporter, partial [Candidatus Nanohaloarchaea archaeon]|nr:AI-2E family transporter [Candidatus Nanohaloarchaea archaeon]